MLLKKVTHLFGWPRATTLVVDLSFGHGAHPVMLADPLLPSSFGLYYSIAATV
jgi:hypothetical protein